jgi:hypothetical protein
MPKQDCYLGRVIEFLPKETNWRLHFIVVPVYLSVSLRGPERKEQFTFGTRRYA